MRVVISIRENQLQLQELRIVIRDRHILGSQNVESIDSS